MTRYFVRKLVKDFLFSLKIPFFTFKVIQYFTRNNIYVEKDYLSNSLLYILHDINGYKKIIISGTGVLILFYDNHIIKLPLGRVSEDSLAKNWINYNKIQNTSISEFIDYKLEKIDNYYKMDKLLAFEVSNENVNTILGKFYNNKQPMILKQFLDNQVINIKLFKKKCNIDIELPFNKTIHSVIMHGDLTKDNIMLNKKGNVVLIDLDRYTECGIISIDKIHYFVDKESKAKGVSFFKYLEFIILHIKEYDFELFDLYLYMLYRISREYRNDITLNEAYYNQMCKLNKLFIEKLA